MVTQEYTTTIGSVKKRLESNKIDRVSVELAGFNVYAEDAVSFNGLNVYDPTAEVKVKEFRHNVNSETFRERRTLRLHFDVANEADGTN